MADQDNPVSVDSFLFYFGMFAVAGASDAASTLLPGVGSFLSAAGIGFIRLMMSLTERKLPFSNLSFASAVGVELFPPTSMIMPGAIGYVFTMLLIEKAQTKLGKQVIGKIGPVGAAVAQSGVLDKKARPGQKMAPATTARGQVIEKKEKEPSSQKPKEFETRPSQQKEEKTPSFQARAEDQFGQEYGPKTSAGQVSQGPIAKPEAQSRFGQKRHPQGTAYRSRAKDQGRLPSRPEGNQPTNPVLRAKQEKDKAKASGVGKIFQERHASPEEDRFGNQAPTIPQKKTKKNEKNTYRKAA